MKMLIDVSHIMGWSGNLTGVERVEYNLIKYYYEATDAEFLYWDDAQVCFRLADRNVVKDAIVERTSETEQRTAAESQSKTLFERAKRKIRRTRGSVETDIPDGTVIIPAGLWDNTGYIDGVKKLAQKHPLQHVVYDMIPLVQKGYVVDYLPGVFGNYMYNILPLCKRILAISECSAHDTRSVLGSQQLRVPEIVTFRLGDEISRAATALRPKGLEGDFILSVGTVEARKNHMLLYYTYKRLLSKNQEVPNLIIAGGRGWLSADFQYIIEHDDDVKDKIKILDKVTDSELRWLYENCLFTVFPSFYEGWGLPIAESLNYGKVTLSSSTSSMPEVGGEFADYFSPYSADELAALIVKYSDKKTLRLREEDLKASYRPKQWNDAARQFNEEADKPY